MNEIGDYKIVKLLGRGSLGTSYVAEHIFLKKTVAIKILPEDFSSEEGFFERFLKGINELAQVHHPHILTMHTVSSAQGYYFLVTDYVANEQGNSKNLAQYIQEKGPLDHNEAALLLHQLAEAIEYAHQKNIIHGFLKPNNILIGTRGHIFVSDFGLSKILGETLLIKKAFKHISDSLVAQSQEFLDHFYFLSPEQKKYQKADQATDIYAFGQICHYVLTGHASEGFLEIDHKGWRRVLEETLSYRQERRRQALSALMQDLLKEITQVPRRIAEQDERETPESFPVFKEINESIIEDHIQEKNMGAEGNKSKTPLINPYPENSVAMMLKKDPLVTEYYPEKNVYADLKPLWTKMIRIPQGSYFRGTDKGNRDESPRHLIHLNSFYLDIHPVTNEQFIRFLEFMGGEKDYNYHDLIRLKDSRISRSAGKLFIEPGYIHHPVVGVTWYGAFSYAEWAGKRLPTEAEWETAASGGNEGIFPTGDLIEKKDANFFSSDTTPVLNYAPNGYGLYDMAGNVYEWCQDWYGYNYYENSAVESNNPKGPNQGVYRVLRGGCWKSLKEDLRIAHRHRNNPGSVNGTYGFRCASDELKM